MEISNTWQIRQIEQTAKKSVKIKYANLNSQKSTVFLAQTFMDTIMDTHKRTV